MNILTYQIHLIEQQMEENRAQLRKHSQALRQFFKDPKVILGISVAAFLVGYLYMHKPHMPIDWLAFAKLWQYL